MNINIEFLNPSLSKGWCFLTCSNFKARSLQKISDLKCQQATVVCYCLSFPAALIIFFCRSRSGSKAAPTATSGGTMKCSAFFDEVQARIKTVSPVHLLYVSSSSLSLDRKVVLW